MLEAVGLGMTMLSPFLGKKSEKDNIKKQNAAKMLQWEGNKALTAEILSVQSNRTERAIYEANRHAIREKFNVLKAKRKVQGDAAVQAASIGAAGKRVQLNIQAPAARMAGDEITDIDTNLQTEFSNITERFNDTAMQAIQNLNNYAPFLDKEPGTMEMISGSAMAGLQFYSGLSDAGKSNFKSLFNTPSTNALSYKRSLFDPKIVEL